MSNQRLEIAGSGPGEYTAATGSAYKQLVLPDEQRPSGRGASWCPTCDGFFLRDQDVVVVGGGDSAVEEGRFLTRFARSVTVVHRRERLRASKVVADRAAADPQLTMARNSEAVAIAGDTKVTGVTLRDTVTGATRELAATVVFVAIGHLPRTDVLADPAAPATVPAAIGTAELDVDAELVAAGADTAVAARVAR